jgi:hypothetical protein
VTYLPFFFAVASSYRASSTISQASSVRSSVTMSSAARSSLAPPASSSAPHASSSSVLRSSSFPGTPVSFIYFPNDLSSLVFHSGLTVPSEQRNNVIRGSFILGTPSFTFGSPRKLIINPALLVDSGCASFLYYFS